MKRKKKKQRLTLSPTQKKALLSLHKSEQQYCFGRADGMRLSRSEYGRRWGLDWYIESVTVRSLQKKNLITPKTRKLTAKGQRIVRSLELQFRLRHAENDLERAGLIVEATINEP